METKLDILRRYFGYTSFRRGQEEIVDALLTDFENVSWIS